MFKHVIIDEKPRFVNAEKKVSKNVFFLILIHVLLF